MFSCNGVLEVLEAKLRGSNAYASSCAASLAIGKAGFLSLLETLSTSSTTFMAVSLREQELLYMILRLRLFPAVQGDPKGRYIW